MSGSCRRTMRRHMSWRPGEPGSLPHERVCARPKKTGRNAWTIDLGYTDTPPWEARVVPGDAEATSRNAECYLVESVSGEIPLPTDAEERGCGPHHLVQVLRQRPGRAREHRLREGAGGHAVSEGARGPGGDRDADPAAGRPDPVRGAGRGSRRYYATTGKRDKVESESRLAHLDTFFTKVRVANITSALIRPVCRGAPAPEAGPGRHRDPGRCERHHQP